MATMVASRRRAAVVVLMLAVLAAAGLLAALGLSELALFFGPALATVALLVAGRYLGEDRILARWSRHAAQRALRAPRRVRRRGSARSLASQLSGGLLVERGPPPAVARIA